MGWGPFVLAEPPSSICNETEIFREIVLGHATIDFGISAPRIEALKTAKNSEAIKKRFAESARLADRRILTSEDLERDFSSSPPSDERISPIYKDVLLSVLTEDELKRIRKLLIRRKFRQPIAVFRDEELLKRCGATAAEIVQLQKLTDDISKSLSQRIRNSRSELGAVVLNLPLESRQLFVDYAGNEFAPGVIPRNASEIDVAALPFPSHIRSPFPIFRAIYSGHAKAAANLTETQIEKLIAVEDEFSKSRNEFADLLFNGKMSKSDLNREETKNVAKAAELTGKIVSADQALILFRLEAAIEFWNNFEKECRRRI